MLNKHAYCIKLYWYSYCLNNPLIYTDPSGYKFRFRDFLSKLFGKDADAQDSENEAGGGMDYGIPDVGQGFYYNFVNVPAGTFNLNMPVIWGGIFSNVTVTAEKDKEKPWNDPHYYTSNSFRDNPVANTRDWFAAEYYTKTGLGGSVKGDILGVQLGLAVDFYSSKRSSSFNGSNLNFSNSKISSLAVSFAFFGISLEKNYTNKSFTGEILIGPFVFSNAGFSTRIASGNFGIIEQIGGQIDFREVYVGSNNNIFTTMPVDNTRVVLKIKK